MSTSLASDRYLLSCCQSLYADHFQSRGTYLPSLASVLQELQQSLGLFLRGKSISYSSSDCLQVFESLTRGLLRTIRELDHQLWRYAACKDTREAGPVIASNSNVAWTQDFIIKLRYFSLVVGILADALNR